MRWLSAITFSTTVIQEVLNVKFSHVLMAKVQPLLMMKPKVSVKSFVTYSTVKDSRGSVSVLSNLIIIKKEVSNLKENLEMIESDDVPMCKLHNRIYDLKMSLLNVDKALAELNFLTRINAKTNWPSDVINPDAIKTFVFPLARTKYCSEFL